MAKEDEEKTAFLTPCGVNCYVCMPFGLKSVGASFQRMMHIVLGLKVGVNAEAYMDVIVVKTREASSLLADLEETFSNLQKVNLKLKPTKCVFGVPQENCRDSLSLHEGSRPTQARSEQSKKCAHLADLKTCSAWRVV